MSMSINGSAWSSGPVDGSGNFSVGGFGGSVVGTYSINASYAGDANYNAASGNTTFLVTKATPTISISSSSNPSNYGGAVTFTATVSAGSGTVTFKDGGATLGTANLSGNAATYSTSSLVAGSHSITATYNGDSNYNAVTSSSLTQTVNKVSASVGLASSASTTPEFGDPITFTATVTPITATGTISFTNASTSLGTGVITNGTATLTTATLPLGTNMITASYSGDVNFSSATSAPVSQPVNRSVLIELVATTGNSVYGDPVSFTATVKPKFGSGSVTGTVSFNDAGLAITGSDRPLIGGTASFTTNALVVGQHLITASYFDGNYTPDLSSGVNVTVSKAASSVSLSSNLNPSPYGQPVAFTATISPSIASGRVKLMDGGTEIADVAVIGGAATYTTSKLSGGTHSMTARYMGDDKYNVSTSDALTQTVDNTPFIDQLSFYKGPSQMGIKITGANFGASQGDGKVTFNGVAARVVPGLWSSNSITVQVPSGNASGEVLVVVGGKSSNPKVFQVDSYGCAVQ
jgi:hypothetical protein